MLDGHDLDTMFRNDADTVKECGSFAEFVERSGKYRAYLTYAWIEGYYQTLA